MNQFTLDISFSNSWIWVGRWQENTIRFWFSTGIDIIDRRSVSSSSKEATAIQSPSFSSISCLRSWNSTSFSFAREYVLIKDMGYAL